MGLKAILSKAFAFFVNRQLDNIRQNALALQQKTFTDLIHAAGDTAFGTDHRFEAINNYDDFKKTYPYAIMRTCAPI
jgi:hypothetical protein